MRKTKGIVIKAILSGIGVLALSQVSHALVLGQVWSGVDTSLSQDALIANAPAVGTGNYAEFYTGAIDYNSYSGGYTVSSFLNNPSFFNQSATFDPNATLNNSYMLFTGSTYLNAGANSFSTPHDDGFELQMSGAFSDAGLTTSFDLQQPGPTAAVTTPYTVYAPTAGLYDFTLSYGECCGAPAVLGFTVNGEPVSGSVPEPASLALFGIGLVGLGLSRKRKQKA